MKKMTVHFTHNYNSWSMTKSYQHMNTNEAIADALNEIIRLYKDVTLKYISFYEEGNE